MTSHSWIGRRRGKEGWEKKTNFFSISSVVYFLFFLGHWSLVLLLHSLSLLWSFSELKIWWKPAWLIKYILEWKSNWCGWDLGGFVGNFAFRFTKEAPFFPALSFSLRSQQKCCFVVSLYLKQVLTVGYFICLPFCPKLCYCNLLEDKEHLKVSVCTWETRGRKGMEKRTSNTLYLLLLMMTLLWIMISMSMQNDGDNDDDNGDDWLNCCCRFVVMLFGVMLCMLCSSCLHPLCYYSPVQWCLSGSWCLAAMFQVNCGLGTLPEQHCVL